MGLSRLPPFVLMTNGSSLSANSRLASQPTPWPDRLAAELPFQPEAVGPVVVIPRGHGGWMSADILGDIAGPGGASERPTHIFLESGDINSCVVSGGVPAETRATKTTNQLTMIADLKAANPAIDITFLSMSPVSTAGAALRPNLADYYADTITTAIAQGVGYLDLYQAWPKPLPERMTNLFDGLHPLMAHAFDVYAYRAILFRARQKMAAWWGLPAPVAPAYAAEPDVMGYLIGGGGPGGGGNGGGGGAAGQIVPFLDTYAALLGAVVVGAAGVYNNGAPGTPGSDSSIGAYLAKGGNVGGFYTSNPTQNRGGDGPSSGGGANSFAGGTTPAAGTSRYGQGNPGGKGSSSAGYAGGGGGGATTPGADASGTADGGLGGLGWHTDSPDGGEDVCGGGPGGNFTGHRQAYQLGGGPTCPGGGGKGGGDNGTGGGGDNGGLGKVKLWYPALAPRGTGGVITTAVVGGVTYQIHTFTANGTLA